MSQLLAQHTADVNHAYGERQLIFPPDDWMWLCVPERLVCQGPAAPR